ncbi:MAG: hypothetical protein ABR567_01775 [Myxococcales bacterium]|nr:hypothetical protein [Myxococcales bacterium]
MLFAMITAIVAPACGGGDQGAGTPAFTTSATLQPSQSAAFKPSAPAEASPAKNRAPTDALPSTFSSGDTAIYAGGAAGDASPSKSAEITGPAGVTAGSAE